MATTKIQSGAFPADVVTTAAIDDLSVTHAKLHTAMDLSSKTVTLPTLSTLSTTGNVGIGIGSPGTKLQVAGTQNTPSGTSKGMLLVRADGSTHGLQMGVLGSAPWGSWIQAQDNNISSPYPLTLQPGGGKVGIGTTSPERPLHVKGANAFVRIESTSASQNSQLDIKSTTAIWSIGQNQVLANTGTLEFYNGSSSPVAIKQDGKVGIGTTSPLSGFHISDGTNAGSPQNANRKATLMIDAGATSSADLQFMVRNGYNSHIFFGDAADPNVGMLWYNHNENSMNFMTNTNTAITIDADQNVDVSSGALKVGGTTVIDSSRNATFTTVTSNGLGVTSTSHSNGATFNSAGTTQLWLRDTDASSNQKNWGFQVSGGSLNILRANDDRASGFVTPIEIKQAPANSLVIDASGNLLVGKNSSNSDVVGVEAAQDGHVYVTVNNTLPFYINRQSGDELLRFASNGTTAGSIKIESGGLTIDGEANHTGLMFASASVLPRDNSASTNGSVDLGTNDGRWKDLWLSGTVNASDLTLHGGGLISSNGTSDTIVLSGSNAEHVGAGITLHGNAHSNASQTWFKAGSTTVMKIAGGMIGMGRDPTSSIGSYLQIQSNDGISLNRSGQTNPVIMRNLTSTEGDGVRFTVYNTGDVFKVKGDGMRVIGYGNSATADNISVDYMGTAGGHMSGYLFRDKRDVVNAAIKNDLQDDGIGTAAAHLRLQTSHGGTLTTQMTIDRYGQVMMPNQPSFRAYSTNDYTANGTLESANWTEQHDNNGDFSNGRFTAPVDGVYLFEIMWDSNASQGGLSLLKNTNYYIVKWEPTGRTDNSWESKHYSTTVKLSSGDYVRLVGVHASGSNPYHMGGGHWGFFAGHLLG